MRILKNYSYKQPNRCSKSHSLTQKSTAMENNLYKTTGRKFRHLKKKIKKMHPWQTLFKQSYTKSQNSSRIRNLHRLCIIKRQQNLLNPICTGRLLATTGLAFLKKILDLPYECPDSLWLLIEFSFAVYLNISGL